MSRTLLAVALSAVVSATVTAGLFASTASATGTKVVCTQVPQGMPRGANGATLPLVDEQLVANFMSEQIAAGRERFQAVQGLSTVLCAW